MLTYYYYGKAMVVGHCFFVPAIALLNLYSIIIVTIIFYF